SRWALASFPGRQLRVLPTSGSGGGGGLLPRPAALAGHPTRPAPAGVLAALPATSRSCVGHPRLAALWGVDAHFPGFRHASRRMAGGTPSRAPVLCALGGEARVQGL